MDVYGQIKKIGMVMVVLLLAAGVFLMNEAVVKAAEKTPTAIDSAFLDKNFVMDTNLTNPAETFVINFAPVSVNGVGYKTTGASAMPGAYTKNIVYNPGETGTTDATSQVKTITKSLTGSNGTTADVTNNSLIPKVEATGDGTTYFNHAGEYVYTVTETAGTSTGVGYSGASYTMRVYIINGTNGLELQGVTVETKKDDSGTDVTTPTKIDPTHGATGNPFAFKNTYDKKAPLTVTKMVDGAQGDQAKDFTFTVTVNKPTGSNTAGPYTAYIYDGTTKIDTAYSFDTGVGKEIKLKHGQSLKFVDADGKDTLPVGTTYTVAEAGTPQYTPQGSVVYNGATTPTQTPAGTSGSAITIHGDGTNGAVNTTVGEAANSTTVTNSYTYVNPTGLFIDNLPYILMILIPAAVIILMVAGKRRKASR